MPKAVVPKDKQDTEEIKQLESLLADVPGSLADLTREGGGYTINVIYLPDLASPKEAHVTILGSGEGNDKPVLDTLTGVKLEDVFEIIEHPTQFSEPLLEYLGGQPKKKAKK